MKIGYRIIPQECLIVEAYVVVPAAKLTSFKGMDTFPTAATTGIKYGYVVSRKAINTTKELDELKSQAKELLLEELAK